MTSEAVFSQNQSHSKSFTANTALHSQKLWVYFQSSDKHTSGMEQNIHSETELVLLFRPIKWVASTFIMTINKSLPPQQLKKHAWACLASDTRFTDVNMATWLHRFEQVCVCRAGVKEKVTCPKPRRMDAVKRSQCFQAGTMLQQRKS